MKVQEKLIWLANIILEYDNIISNIEIKTFLFSLVEFDEFGTVADYYS